MEEKMANLTVKHFAPLIVAGIAALAAGAASGFEITQPIPGGDQTACLDVPASNTTSGTPINAYPCNGGFNEQWMFDPQGHLEGIGTANGATECLERNGSNLAILSSCSQTFGVTFEGNHGWIFLEPGGTFPSCLDSKAKYGSTAQVSVGPCDPRLPLPSQSWVLRDIAITQPIPSTDQTACVDVSDNAINSGAPVIAYPCKLGGNERWTYFDGELQGVSTKSVTTCLAWDSSTNKVQLQTACGGSNTLWQIGGGTIVNFGANKCLDSQSNYGSKAQLILSVCASLSPSQLWSLR
jgi:hypothetical protein